MIITIKQNRFFAVFLSCLLLIFGFYNLTALAENRVFLDLKLPDGDGLRLLSCIKKINPSTAVNIISAYGTEEVRDKARKLGAYGFIDKPFSEETILRNIRELRKVGVS